MKKNFCLKRTKQKEARNDTFILILLKNCKNLKNCQKSLIGWKENLRKEKETFVLTFSFKNTLLPNGSK